MTAQRWPALVVAGVLLVAGGPLACVTAAAAAATDELEEIVVTGSRIVQRLGDTPTRVFVVGREAIEGASRDGIGKVLQQLPVNTGFSTNTNVNNAGDGTTRMNLRGLGAERTLVLLNGRRFVNGGNGGDAAVDLDMIPQSVVERVEVMGVGASTVYGSDAIGGVVNIITREGYQGTEARGAYTTSEHADGTVYDVSFVAGRTGEHGYVTLGGELVDQEAVFQRERGFARRTEYVRNDGSIGHGGSWATPQGWFVVPVENALGLPGGAETIYTRVDGSGNPPTAGDFRAVDLTTDRYDFAPVNYLQTPSRRQYLWMLGGWNVSDGVEAFAEAVIHRRASQQLLAPALFYSGDPAAGAPILENGEPGIPADNYYNPFRVDLGGGSWALRRFSESVGRRFAEDAETQRYVAGARGTVGRSGWHWEASANYGRNATTTTTRGEFRADRLRLALGPSGLDAAGHVVCGRPDAATGIVPADAVIDGCVPMNLFGGQGTDGRGTITRSMLDYATETLTDEGYNEQQVFEAILRGPWGTLRGSPVEWALGASRRVESAAARLDAAKLAGTAGGLQYNLNDGGQFTANEAYVEAAVPLLNDRPGGEELTVTGGLRYADFSSFGPQTTYQTGLLYRPLPGVTLRGGYGTVFRAPPIGALYSSNLTTVNSYRDPCGNGPTPEQAVHCSAAGVPGGSYVQSEFDEFAEVVGGNPDLQPETGTSLAAGVTLTPASARGLELSADYWRTSLGDVITVDPFGGNYTQSCADSGAVPACSRVHRRADGSIALVDARNANDASLVASGVDLDLGYATSLDGAEWSARATASYLAQYDYLPAAGAKTIHGAGHSFSAFEALPHWRGLGDLQYSRGPWTAVYRLQYVGAIEQCRGATDAIDDEFVGCRRVDDRWYQDVRFRYGFAAGLAIALAVNNLAGTDPPRVSYGGANTYPWMYPLLGRSYVAELSLRVQ